MPQVAGRARPPDSRRRRRTTTASSNPPTSKKYADGDVPIDYFKAGALLVDWAVVQTKGDMNALVLIATGPLSTDSMMAGIKRS